MYITVTICWEIYKKNGILNNKWGTPNNNNDYVRYIMLGQRRRL